MIETSQFEDGIDDNAENTKNAVLAEIRKNYSLALLCILPNIENRTHKLKSSARQLEIDAEKFERYQEMLLGSGLWIRKGKITEANFEHLDLGDLTVQDHLSMTINIISRLAGTELPYEYESLSLGTNKALIKVFVGKIRKALKELYQDSLDNKENNDCLFSWSQTGMINHQVDLKEKSRGDQDGSY